MKKILLILIASTFISLSTMASEPESKTAGEKSKVIQATPSLAKAPTKVNN